MSYIPHKEMRPWGYYEVLLDTPLIKVKQIYVLPGKQLSLQRHQKRDEHWFFTQGTGWVFFNPNMSYQRRVAVGLSLDIPRGTVHRVRNASSVESLKFIEIQIGDYFGEDDIERLEDDYGRAS